jgi:hypothetical protein
MSALQSDELIAAERIAPSTRRSAGWTPTSLTEVWA